METCDWRVEFLKMEKERNRLIAEAEQFRAEAVLNAKNMAMLEGERDRLKEAFEWKDKAYVTCRKEIDRLKAELAAIENCNFNHCILLEDRDLWKSKCKKLAEALRKIYEGDPEGVYAGPTAKAALAAFDKETQS